MKTYSFAIFVTLAILSSACSMTRIVPTSANVDDSILMLSANRDIRPVYAVKSDQPDGNLPIYDQKERALSVNYMHQTESALKQLYEDYSLTKFNINSDDEIKINIHMQDFKVYKKDMTGGLDKFAIAMVGTGQMNFVFEVLARFVFDIEYKGQNYHQAYNIKVDNQSQANYYSGYGGSNKNETELVSKDIEKCFNKGIMYLDNYLKSIIKE